MIEWSPFSTKALDFIRNSDARLNIAHGAVRSSKTIACTVRWLEYIATGPPGDLAMLGRTTSTLQRNVLNTIFDIVGPSKYKWVNKQAGELNIMGRRIYCFGANNEDAESKIRGATFAGAYCDEVSLYPQCVFNQLMARMSIANAKCFCNTNPDSPYHWFYTDYISSTDITDKKTWKFLMEDNLSLDQDYVDSLKQMYRGVWYERMILGNWVSAQGRIYDMLEDDRHIIDVMPYIESKGVASLAIRWLVGLDYGTSSVTTWGLFAKLPDGTLCKVREYYYDAPKQKAQKTDSEFLADFKLWLGNIKPFAVYCDPAAASIKLELMRAGFRVLNADNDVVNGIRYVASRFNLGTLYIDKSCTNTIKEYMSYVWDPVAQLNGMDKPLKQHDHTCDSDRYVVYTDSQNGSSGVY